jgi:hypothetical protein
LVKKLAEVVGPRNLTRFDRGLDRSLALDRFVVLEWVRLKGEPKPMPDLLWTILADPANRPMLAATIAGIVVILAGPWAIVKIASRRAARVDADAAE